LSAHLWLLHLRAGGKKVWGRYPFHEAAFLGGPDTVRSLRRERYAGDAAVFGNAELRLPLFRFTLLLPIRVGVLGLADAGRVYLDGESSDKWHKGYGGGVFFSLLKPENTISITAAMDPDATGADRSLRVYFNAGFAF
jgi:hemolysin activation/secretion protein